MATDPLSLDFGRDKQFCVYVYYDPRPRKKRVPIYVGKGRTKSRPDEHWRYRASNSLLRNILAKLRAANLEPIVELVGFFDSNDDAIRLEKYLIAKFGRRNNGTGTLCNFTDGGEGTIGTVVSPETKRRLSDAHKGHYPSAETRAKMSKVQLLGWQDPDRKARHRAALLGREVTAATRAKIGAGNAISLRGKSPSAETRAGLSLAQTKRWARMTREERYAHAIKCWQGRSPEDQAAHIALLVSAAQKAPRPPYQPRDISDDTRKKMSEAGKRRAPCSPETRAKLSESGRRAWATRRTDSS